MNPLNDKPIEAQGQDQSRGEPMHLFSDKPIERPDDDDFGFSPFAEALAQSMIKNDGSEGTVMAIHGPWGSGKSSVINLVKHYLEEKIKSPNSFEFPKRAPNWLKSLAPKRRSRQSNGNTINVSNVSLEILDFKCWWFRGEEALMIEFFHQLYSALDKSGVEVAKKAVSRLGSIMLRNLAPLTGATTNHFAPGTGEMASTGMNLLSKIIQEEETVEMLYDEISQALSKSKKRYMMIIDDIDRLSPDEALLIFRLVKSVGQLPKITYLLAYDRDLAEKIISDRYPSEGPHYLEKIVQAPFDIPYPLRSALLNVFVKSVGELWKESQESEYWREYAASEYRHFWSLFDNVVAPQIQSPRDIIRIMNALKVSWPAIAGEVEPTDFLALETLRVKQPGLHAILKSNKQKLIDIDMGVDDVDHVGEDRELRASRYEGIFLGEFQNGKREEVKKALPLLFPRLGSVWERSGTSSSDRDNWKRQRRVCSPEYFDTYFRFSLSPETISIEEVNAIIRSSGDENYVKNAILEASKKSNGNGTCASILLEELRVHAKSIPIENAEAFLSGLFSVHDSIDVESDQSDSSMFRIDNSHRICSLSEKLLLYITNLDKRSEIISQAISHASLGLIAILVRQEYFNYYPPQDQSPRSKDMWIMTKPDMEKLQQVFLTRVRSAAKNDSLFKILFKIRKPGILYSWELLDDSEGEEKEVKSWCMEQLNEDTAVEMFARIFIQEGTVTSIDQGTNRSYFIQIDILERFFDIQRLRQRIEEVLSVSASNPDSERYKRLELFKNAFDNKHNGHF